MELEVTDMPAHVKGKMAARVKSYKNELARLQRDFVSKWLLCNISALPQFVCNLYCSFGSFQSLV